MIIGREGSECHEAREEMRGCDLDTILHLHLGLERGGGTLDYDL